MIHTDGRPTIAMRESDRQHSVKVKDDAMDYAASVALKRVASAIERNVLDGTITTPEQAIEFMRAVARKFS